MSWWILLDLIAPLQVRIFTFSVGQHNYDKGPIQWMACSNKGTAQLIININTECWQFITIQKLELIQIKLVVNHGLKYILYISDNSPITIETIWFFSHYGYYIGRLLCLVFLGYFYEIPSIGAIRINTQVIVEGYRSIHSSYIIHSVCTERFIWRIRQCCLCNLGVPGCSGETHGSGRQAG